MGFLRKTLFVSTGGLSGAVGIKANSKKSARQRRWSSRRGLCRRLPAVRAPRQTPRSLLLPRWNASVVC